MVRPGRYRSKNTVFSAFSSGKFTSSAVKLFAFTFFLSACGPEKPLPEEIATPPVPPVVRVTPPVFNEDSAYAYVKAQVDFGPRVPGTPAHAKCAEWLSKKLKSYNFEVTIPQGITIQTYDKKQFVLKNIIAQYKPELSTRILLCSHWDTRHISESDEKDPDKPNDGANDGASGVGVAMEIARLVNQKNPNVGVDIIYFDLEDYGQNGNEDSWCLGSKYWAKNLHKKNYVANYGILMDMVGGPGAIFPKEDLSMQYAPNIVDKVWKTAHDIGYGNFFMMQTKRFVGSDDHIPVNLDANIPCIDIIEFNQATGGFPSYHHTHKDNMDMIDRKTLKAVGQTLLEVIYNEK